MKRYEIGIPKYFGPDSLNQTNRDPEVFRERENSENRNLDLSRFHKFYRKYIYPYDPDHYALRFALKSSGAILVSVLLLYHYPILPVWAGLAAWMVSQAKTGETRRFRMAILLSTGVTMALLVPLATGLTGTFWPAIIFILGIAFCAFYLNVLGPAYGKAGLFILVACAFASGKPGSWAQGLVRSEGLLIGTAIAFVAHFLIMPLRPTRILHTRLNIIVNDLCEFLTAVSRGYRNPTEETGRIITLKQRTLKSLEEFNRLPDLLQPAPWVSNSREAAVLAFGLDLNRLFRNIVTLWQVRLNGEGSAIFKEALPRLVAIMDNCTGWLKAALQALNQGEDRPDGESIISDLEAFYTYLKKLRENQINAPADWMPIFNAYLSLRSISLTLSRAGAADHLEERVFQSHLSRLNFRSIKTRIISNLHHSSSAFRLALQGAVAAGSGLAIIKLLPAIIDLRYGYWIVMFGIISLKPTLGSALKSGRYRIAGTVIGAGTAVLILMVIGTHLIPAIGILVIALFLMLYFIRLPYQILSLSLSTLTFCLLIGLLSGLSWRLGLDRIGNTVIALAIGLTCSLLIWPNRAGRQLILRLSRGLKAERTFFNSIFHDYRFGHGESHRSFHLRRYTEDTLKQIQSTYNEASAEPGKNAPAAESVFSIIKHLNLILDSLLGMEILAEIKTDPQIREKLDPLLIAFRRNVTRFFTSLSEELRGSGPIPELTELSQSYTDLRAALKKLRYQNRPLDTLLDFASILWHIDSLINELEEIRKPIKRLSPA